ncbi:MULTISPECIES: hypothetical protein [unclassified Cytobacillus]|uniref:hypothetical protein n=1 Tax=unclassified Cytobacillus TaxID=2675268 RepID=UPI0013576601|nr:hypothetical protein [Cytobacillus sp. AMY 15.2]MCM3089983.1 hypothetical protein [Cytobacillus sp. AMY 15.2]
MFEKLENSVNMPIEDEKVSLIINKYRAAEGTVHQAEDVEVVMHEELHNEARPFKLSLSNENHPSRAIKSCI